MVSVILNNNLILLDSITAAMDEGEELEERGGEGGKRERGRREGEGEGEGRGREIRGEERGGGGWEREERGGGGGREGRYIMFHIHYNAYLIVISIAIGQKLLASIWQAFGRWHAVESDHKSRNDATINLNTKIAFSAVL